jgi:hypothetical protein
MIVRKYFSFSIVTFVCALGSQEVFASEVTSTLPDIGIQSRMCDDKLGKKCTPPGSQIECSIKDKDGKIVGGYYLLCVAGPSGQKDGVVEGVGKKKKDPIEGKVTTPGKIVPPPPPIDPSDPTWM